MLLLAGLLLIGATVIETARVPVEQRYLYVALPGPDDAGADRSVRILVFDIADGHRLVRRIPVWPGRGDEAEVVRARGQRLAGRFFISDQPPGGNRSEMTGRVGLAGTVAIALPSPDGQTIMRPLRPSGM